MAWNSNLPGNSEKIKDLGRVIRPNWDAIQQADEIATPDVIASASGVLRQKALQFVDRNTEATAATPVVVGTTHYLYSRQDSGSAIQELFSRSAAGHIVQLTNDRGLGGSVPRLFLSDFEFTQNMLPCAMAVVTGGAAYTREVNFNTVVEDTTGRYHLVTDAVFANANVYVMATADRQSTRDMNATLEEAPTIAAGALTIKINVKNGSTNRTGGFTIVIFGGVA